MDDDCFTLNPSSNVWLDNLVVLIRSKTKTELHTLLLDYRREFADFDIDRWLLNAEEAFAEELALRKLSDIFVLMLAAERYMQQDFQPTDTPVLRELTPEGVLYGPVGYGAQDEWLQRYAMLFSDVYLLCKYQGEDDHGVDEWRITVFFRGMFVKSELDKMILNAMTEVI